MWAKHHHLQLLRQLLGYQFNITGGAALKKLETYENGYGATVTIDNSTAPPGLCLQTT